MTPADFLLWRRERRISKSELATLLGVNRRTIWCWENARTKMPRDIASRLTATLGRMADAPITSATHPRFYKPGRMGKKIVQAVMPNHPHHTWRLTPSWDDLERFTGYDVKFKLANGVDLRVVDAVNLPTGTTLMRSDDGQNFYQWIIPS